VLGALIGSHGVAALLAFAKRLGPDCPPVGRARAPGRTLSLRCARSVPALPGAPPHGGAAHRRRAVLRTPPLRSGPALHSSRPAIPRAALVSLRSPRASGGKDTRPRRSDRKAINDKGNRNRKRRRAPRALARIRERVPRVSVIVPRAVKALRFAPPATRRCAALTARKDSH